MSAAVDLRPSRRLCAVCGQRCYALEHNRGPRGEQLCGACARKQRNARAPAVPPPDPREDSGVRSLWAELAMADRHRCERDALRAAGDNVTRTTRTSRSALSTIGVKTRASVDVDSAASRPRARSVAKGGRR